MNSMCNIIPTPIFYDKNVEIKDYSSFKKITGDELFNYFNNRSFLNKLQKLIIIDVRYYYEFRGGRIIGAKNIQTKDELKRLYKKYKEQGKTIGIIFHCEYSQERSPKVMNIFRKYDRELNIYPNLSFPNLYLLEGGYKDFYKHHSELCCGGYTPMRDIKYINNGELKRCTSFFRTNMLQEIKCSKIEHTIPLLPDIIDLAFDDLNFDIGL